MSLSTDTPPFETNPRALRCLLGMAGPLVALNLPGLGWGVRIWRRKGLAGAHGSIGIEHNGDDGSSTEGGEEDDESEDSIDKRLADIDKSHADNLFDMNRFP